MQNQDVLVVNEKTGRIMRGMRVQLNYTQAEFGGKIGVSQPTVAAIVRINPQIAPRDVPTRTRPEKAGKPLPIISAAREPEGEAICSTPAQLEEAEVGQRHAPGKDLRPRKASEMRNLPRPHCARTSARRRTGAQLKKKESDGGSTVASERR